MIVYRLFVYIVSVAFFLLEATHGLRAGSLARGLEPRQTSTGATVANDSKFIDQLWDGNKYMVDQFLNNEFVMNQSTEEDNSKTLPSYKHYSLQDYYYLLDFVKYQALRLAAFPDISNPELESYLAKETKSMADFAAYPSKFRNETLVGKLNITSTEIENGTRTVAELAYSNWLQKNEDSGWFTLYVKSIPCVYGWQKLAEKLHNDNNTKNNTFYSTWIEPNWNLTSPGQELSDLLDKYVERYNTTYMWNIWNSTFVEALQFEIDFFNDSLNKTL